MGARSADLQRRLTAAAGRTWLLSRAVRERRLAAQRRYLLLHRAAVERQLAVEERRVRLLRLLMLGRGLAMLAAPAVAFACALGATPAVGTNVPGVDGPSLLLTVAVLTAVLWPYAFRPYALLTSALLIRALLTYALLQGAERAGGLLIRSMLTEANDDPTRR